jgi:hypothetical protein
MDVTALVIAIISAAVAIASALINRSTAKEAAELRTEHDKLLELFKQRLQSEKEAAERLRRYREPLVAAAFDLQHRLGNIVQGDFLSYLADANRDAETINTTLFRLAQYFGWTEILRRDVEFLQFSEDEETRAAWEALTHVSTAFASDGYAEGTSFMLWVEEQRGIGERMIVTDGATSRCIGYATFVDQREEKFARLFARFEADLRDSDRVEKSERLPELQHLLIHVVKLLDPTELRYRHAGMDAKCSWVDSQSSESSASDTS